MAIALVSKPGLTGASALSIPKEWDAAWFRGFINNLLKGGDVRNAQGVNGISVTGSIASPYATIGFAAPITLPGPVTITAPVGAFTALTVNAASGQNAALFQGSLVAGASFGPLVFAGTNASDFAIRIRDASGVDQFFSITGQGAAVMGSPIAAVTALTVNGFSAATFVENLVAGSANMTVALLQLAGGSGSVGTETIRINNCATTGTGTATFTATNKPTATAGGPVTWIPINLDGNRRYIPVWA